MLLFSINIQLENQNPEISLALLLGKKYYLSILCTACADHVPSEM